MVEDCQAVTFFAVKHNKAISLLVYYINRPYSGSTLGISPSVIMAAPPLTHLNPTGEGLSNSISRNTPQTVAQVPQETAHIDASIDDYSILHTDQRTNLIGLRSTCSIHPPVYCNVGEIWWNKLTELPPFMTRVCTRQDGSFSQNDEVQCLEPPPQSSAGGDISTDPDTDSPG